MTLPTVLKVGEKKYFRFWRCERLGFHATKIFHTVEGGGLVIKDDSLFEKAKG